MPGPNYEQLPLVGLLGALANFSGLQVRSELGAMLRRLDWRVQPVVGAVEARDEWTQLVRAGLAYDLTAVVPSAAAANSIFELACPRGPGSDPAPGGRRLLIKRIILSTNVGGAAMLFSIYDQPLAMTAAGAASPALNKLRNNQPANLQDNPVVAKAGSTVLPLTGAQISYQQVCPASGSIQIQDDTGFLWELGPGGATFGRIIGVAGNTLNQGFVVTIEYANVPDGGY